MKTKKQFCNVRTDGKKERKLAGLGVACLGWTSRGHACREKVSFLASTASFSLLPTSISITIFTSDPNFKVNKKA